VHCILVIYTFVVLLFCVLLRSLLFTFCFVGLRYVVRCCYVGYLFTFTFGWLLLPFIRLLLLRFSFRSVDLRSRDLVVCCYGCPFDFTVYVYTVPLLRLLRCCVVVTRLRVCVRCVVCLFHSLFYVALRYVVCCYVVTFGCVCYILDCTHTLRLYVVVVVAVDLYVPLRVCVDYRCCWLLRCVVGCLRCFVTVCYVRLRYLVCTLFVLLHLLLLLLHLLRSVVVVDFTLLLFCVALLRYVVVYVVAFTPFVVFCCCC